MAGTDITDTLLTAGQNEGVERSVLPMPQLATVVNARLRKQSRWGKRYGHASLSTTNLGTGTNLPRCIGGSSNGGFAIVDDQCNGYNETTSTFVSPSFVMPATLATNPRIPGAVSGWLPDTSFFPVPARSFQRQKTTPCASCYALGYLWTAIQYENPFNATDQMIRVVATDPVDQTLVFVQEFTAALATFGGIYYPRLIACGSTVVLTYVYVSAAATPTVMARRLTSLAGQFGAEAAITAVGAAAGYDASPYSSTSFLLAVARAAAVAYVALVDAATFGIGATQLTPDIATAVSVVGTAAAGVYVGYGMAPNITKVSVYPGALGAIIGTATVSIAYQQRPLLCLNPAGGVRVVFGSSVGGSPSLGIFNVRDVSAAGAAGANSYFQNGMYPIANPFVVGSTIYLWAKTETGPASSSATLLRLPAPATFGAGGLVPISCPLEMSVQDYVVSLGQGSTFVDLAGVPSATQIGTTTAYTVTVPTLYTAPGSAVTTGHDFRVIQAKHYTDSAARRSVAALYADSSSFVPMGALTSVDDRGANEQGFLFPPAMSAPTPGGGGSLTPSGTYYYTAVYKARKSSGRFEYSAPSIPVSVTMGGAQTSNLLAITTLAVTARPSVQVEIYRTLANGQTFYLNRVIDSDITAAGGRVTYTDLLSDATQASQQALYTQVGQTLPNAFPPASRFGCVGGQRLFLGGLIRSDLVQASKLIFGDQSPSFCDSDAFRIVLPAACTGLAWMDVLVMFTAEGIYIASGDGPSDDGLGDFGNLTRMPYELGCIEPRSVKVIDDGCFFQTSRGLYLLPRGFGAPVPAGDNVMETLRTYPVITGAATVTKDQEQSALWSCTDSAGSVGARIAYDIAHKTWSVDRYPSANGIANISSCGMGQWLNGEAALFSASTSYGLLATNSLFSEADGTGIAMSLETGDLRPFGTMSEGVISKIDLLAELRSACTLNITKTTENNTAFTSRVFALAAGDYNLGNLAVTETELGNSELRDVMSLRVQYSETSTSEGLAFIALSVEHEQGQGLKRVSDLSRNT
jgi:hypothetical protein